MSTLQRAFYQREHLFPIVFCLIMPWLTMINSPDYLSSTPISAILARWVFILLFLLAIWYLNAFVLRQSGRYRIPLLIGANIVLVGTIWTILPLFVVDVSNVADTPIWIATTKTSMGVVMIIAIQLSFKKIRENEQLKTENFALQTENYRAQLDQLQKQVNPHFLFNSLSTLQTMIRSQDAHSEDFVLRLSDVYRQLLQTRASNVVSLAEELKFLDSYLYLLRTRHGEGLSVHIDTLPASQKLKLPSFGLQLLVENCTKHNIASVKRPLRIDISQPDPAHITVSNNFQPKKKVQSFGVGLDNLKRRYELLKVSEGVRVEQDDHSFSVTLKLF